MANAHGYRSLATCFALVALISNVVASAFCCVPSVSRKTVVIDPILGAIPLCTNASGTSDSGKLPKSSKQHCPVCLAAAHHAAIGPGTFALSFATSTTADKNPTRPNAPTVQKHLNLGGLGSRAPPLPA